MIFLKKHNVSRIIATAWSVDTLAAILLIKVKNSYLRGCRQLCRVSFRLIAGAWSRGVR
jgi:hypothetical protein